MMEVRRREARQARAAVDVDGGCTFPHLGKGSDAMTSNRRAYTA